MDFLYNNFWLTGSLACLAFGGLGVGTWVHQRKRGMDASMCSEGKVTREELFETADKALYKAKANGKNGYVVAKNGELLTDVSHCCSKE